MKNTCNNVDKGLLLACSGLLGNKVLRYLYKKEKIYGVLTDKKSNEIINFCNKNKINCFTGNARQDVCFEFLKKYQNCILFSVNYLFLFDERTINLFEYKFNIHGSLLPKYRGRTPHVWAIINNEKKTGITIHQIVLECDAGDIYYQKEVPIQYGDTGGSTLNKYFYHYPRLIVEFLQVLRMGKLISVKQNAWLATYFDKRISEDGRINWDWQRERIYNWVRALAPPYPGAFCYLDNSKVIIKEIRFSDHGFLPATKNGTIVDIQNNSFIVKTSNGCIEITDYTIEANIILTKENVLI
jgi:methionyl-tRNA formyltransferase